MKKVSFVILTAALAILVAGVARAETRAYPVPWVAADTPSPFITFTDLPGSGSIRIFTVSGDEVVTLPIQPGQGTVQWPVTNASGHKVASGVYFYLIDGNDTETKGKLVVIR